ncbi:hypothetical protein CF326_g6440 [Tilletia indica]|nr:hypothetical protein CF326_g6440 [Tilletia indica]
MATNERVVIKAGLGPVVPGVAWQLPKETEAVVYRISRTVKQWKPTPAERDLRNRINRASEALTEAEEAAYESLVDESRREKVVVAVRAWMDVVAEYIELPGETMALASRMWDQVQAVRPTMNPSEYQIAAVGAMYRASCVCGHPEYLLESEITVLEEFKWFFGGWIHEDGIEAASEMVGRCVHAAESTTDDEIPAPVVVTRAEVGMLRAEARAHAMAALTFLGKGAGCSGTVIDAAKDLFSRYIAKTGQVPPAWKRYEQAALVICSGRANREALSASVEPRNPGIKQVAEFVGCETEDIRNAAWYLRKAMGMPTAGEEEGSGWVTGCVERMAASPSPKS